MSLSSFSMNLRISTRDSKVFSSSSLSRKLSSTSFPFSLVRFREIGFQRTILVAFSPRRTCPRGSTVRRRATTSLLKTLGVRRQHHRRLPRLASASHDGHDLVVDCCDRRLALAGCRLDATENGAPGKVADNRVARGLAVVVKIHPGCPWARRWPSGRPLPPGRVHRGCGATRRGARSP